MFRYPNNFIFFILLSTYCGLNAQDNYHCDYHTQSGCTSTSYGSSTEYNSQSSQLITNSNYTSSIIGTTSNTSTSTSSSVDDGESGGSSPARASIAIAYVNSNDTAITVLPMSYDWNDHLAYHASVSYVDDSLTGERGMGDSTIGVSYKFFTDEGINGADREFTTDRSTNYIKVLGALSLPTGDADKGLSLDLYTVTGGIEFSRKIDMFNSNITLAHNYNTVVDIPEFNVFDVISNEDNAVQYGDKRITIVGYDQMLSKMLQLNLKYLFLSSESTMINGEDQNDETDFEDISVGVSVSLFYTAISGGLLIPVDESYGSGVSDPDNRKLVYYVSLSKAF